MDSFTKTTLKVTRGYTYTYYTLTGDVSKPALLLLQGWPDHAAMWSKVATLIHKELPNYPISIPDMLGFDGTDKPTNPAEYAWHNLTGDWRDILDADSTTVQEDGQEKEGEEKSTALCNGTTIPIGHDWGSATASRLYNFHPAHVIGSPTSPSHTCRPPGRIGTCPP